MPHTTNLDCCSMISKAQQQNIQKWPVTVADSLNLNQWNGALKGNFNAVSIANRYHSVWQPTMPNAQFELIRHKSIRAPMHSSIFMSTVKSQ